MQTLPSGIKKVEANDNATVANFNVNADLLDAKITELDGVSSTVESATSAATPSTLVQRDASGRFKAAAPVAADDVARKQEITDHADLKATTTQWGHTKLNNTINSSATNEAATAAAVKAAYDHANRIATDFLPDGTDINIVTQSGFYRLQTGHPNAPAGSGYGTMIVTHIHGTDTISQLVFAANAAQMWVRTGNPPNVGGTGVWSAWGEIMTQYGGTFTGPVNVNQGMYLGNQSPLYGGSTDTNYHTLAVVTAGNVAAFGSTNLGMQLHSPSIPSWWNGSVLRELLHNGGGQTIQGAMTLNGNLVVTGVGAIYANNGAFYLGNPATGSTLVGPHTIFNVYGDNLRFYESGGSNRGVSLNLTQCANGAGSELWHTGLLRNNGGVLELNNGGTWTPVGGIKKVQRGTIVIPSAGGGATASINPVNPDKTFITFPTIVTETGESMGGANITARLTSPTTVSFSSGPFIGATASYEVVESY